MNAEQLIADIKGFCTSHADEAAALKYSRYFKGDLYNGYGLSAPLLHGKARELSQNKEITLRSAMDAANEIIPHGRAEELTILMLLIKNLHKQFTPETFQEIDQWYKIGINNWAHADTVGMLILPAFFKNRLVSLPDFKPWLTAFNKFQRRSVPVTLIKSLKTHSNFQELFDFIECLMTDPEREVHQGTGWFLREAWKRNAPITEQFLLKWKDHAPRLIIQYATEKMLPADKTTYRKLKTR